MVPPEKVYYYFTINKDKDVTANDQWTSKNILLLDQTLNVVQVSIEDNEIPAICHHVFPRSTPSIEPDRAVSLTKPVRKPLWSIRNSIMNSRSSENDSKKPTDPPDAYEKAFEFEWKLVDFGRFIKDERKLELVKEAWLNHYSLLRATFQWYAGNGGNGPDYLSLTDFQDFIFDIEISHPKIMNMKQVEAVWIDSFRDKKEITNPKAELIKRAKFMELLTRISVVRFTTKKKGIKANDAVVKIMEEYVKQNGKYVEPNGYRSTLCTHDYDDVLRSYLPVLKVTKKLTQGCLPRC